MPISITKQNRRFICDYTTIGRLPLTTFWGKKKSNVLTSIKIQKSVTGTRCIQLHLFFFQTEVLAFMYVHIISSVEINKCVYTQTCHCITGKYPQCDSDPWEKSDREILECIFLDSPELQKFYEFHLDPFNILLSCCVQVSHWYYWIQHDKTLTSGNNISS